MKNDVRPISWECARSHRHHFAMKLYKCLFPGCGNLVKRPRYYCDTHKQGDIDRKARQDRLAAEAPAKNWKAHHEKNGWMLSVYKTPEWKALRRLVLKEQPQCARCGEKATSVDHIEPLSCAPSRAYDRSNLQALCKRCHDEKSREDGAKGKGK